LNDQRPAAGLPKRGGEGGLTFKKPWDDDAREHFRVLHHEGLSVGRPASEIRLVRVARADHFKRLAQENGFLALPDEVLRPPPGLGTHGVVNALTRGHRVVGALCSACPVISSSVRSKALSVCVCVCVFLVSRFSFLCFSPITFVYSIPPHYFS